MKFTIGSLKNVEPNLSKLVRADLPIKMAYQLSGFYNTILNELTKIEDLRKALVIRYGDVNEETGGATVREELMEDFVKEYNELMDEEIEISFTPIQVKDLMAYNERLEKMGHTPIILNTIDIINLMTIGVLTED